MSNHTTTITFAGYDIIRLRNGSVRITQGERFIDQYTRHEFGQLANRVWGTLWTVRQSTVHIKHILVLALVGTITPDQLEAAELNPDEGIHLLVAGAYCIIKPTEAHDQRAVCAA